jgi:ribosomal protein L37AE/L43A
MTVAGGAYAPTTVTAVLVKNAIKRLREEA